MKKNFFWGTIAILIFCLMFAGCGPASESDAQETADVSQTALEGTSTPAADTPAISETPVSGPASPGESYSAFARAKSVVIAKLSNGLFKNNETTATEMTMLGASMADLIMLPAKFFGEGQESAAAGLAMLSASDVKYTENGNNYTITYSNQQGDTYAFSGTFDAAADALVCTLQENGVDSFYAEYRRTSYGYVSQYFFINDDGTTDLYQLAINGGDGVFGISKTVASQPPALTGSESADFPTALPEWYGIAGSTISGVMPDGTEVNFEYVPSASE